MENLIWYTIPGLILAILGKIALSDLGIFSHEKSNILGRNFGTDTFYLSKFNVQCMEKGLLLASFFSTNCIVTY